MGSVSLQFVFERLNGIPKEAHGADFSRVKPWYLDGQAAHLRQTILLSAYETPEIRHLFNKQLSNVAGKVESVQSYEGVLHRIKPGVKQTFFRFDTQSIQKEDDARFQYFTQKVSGPCDANAACARSSTGSVPSQLTAFPSSQQTLPALRKSAVASQNTLIFIPSYFDFVRVNAYLKELDDFSYAVLSESVLFAGFAQALTIPQPDWLMLLDRGPGTRVTARSREPGPTSSTARSRSSS